MDLIENRSTAAAVGIDAQNQLFYIFAPTIVYDADKNPVAVKGSISDDRSQVPMVISITMEDALGRFTVVEKVQNQPDGARVGSRALSPEELEGTELTGEGYRVRSLNNIFCLSMGKEKIVGNILDENVQNLIGAKWPGDGIDWSMSAKNSIESKSENDTIWENIQSSEGEVVSEDYTTQKYPTSAPIVHHTLADLASLDEVVRDRISMTLGIQNQAPAAAVVAPSPQKVQVVLQDSSDRKEKHETIKAIRFYSLLLSTGQVDLANKTIDNVAFGKLDPEIIKALSAKGLDEQARILGQIWKQMTGANHGGGLTFEGGIFKFNPELGGFFSMPFMQTMLLKALARARFDSTYSTDTMKDSNTVSMEDFTPQIQNSARIKNAKQADDDEAEEDAVEQADIHKRKKRNTFSSTGSVSTFEDVPRTSGNLTAFSLIAETKNHYEGNGGPGSNPSIWHLLFWRLTKILDSPKVRTWYKKHEAEMPQFIFWAIRQVETAFVHLVAFAQSLEAEAAYDADDVTKLPMPMLKLAVNAVANCEARLLDMTATDSQLQDVTSNTPAECNPMNKKVKMLVQELNASKASSRRTSANATNHDADSGGSGGGGSRGTGGTGGNSSRSAGGSRSTSGNRFSGNRSGGANSGGGAQGRTGGRTGGAGRGAGRGGGRGDRQFSGSNSSMGDIYFDPNLVSERDILPHSLQGVLCPKWLGVGLSCPKRYNQCVCHIKIDMMRRTDEKDALVNHVVQTDGLWFNEASVHTLTEPAQVAKLGGRDGPRGTN